MVIFAILERRQRVAVNLDQGAPQRFGGGAVGNSVEPRNGSLVGVAQLTDLAQFAPDIDAIMRLQTGDAVGEQLQAQFALDAMRPGDRGQRNALGASGRR